MSLSEGTGQLTIVALFGDKQENYPELWSMMKELQTGIATVLGKESFEPYTEQRIHGTIIGLEGDRCGPYVLNRNAYQRLGRLCAIELESAIDYLLAPNDILPVSLQIGAFKKGESYPFTSQGSHPYFRSFSIQGTIAVAMGWPHEKELFTSGIDKLRRAFNNFNIYHKYHNSDNAYDNDFFFVLGNVSKDLNAHTITTCEDQIREMLARADVPPIVIDKEQLRIVAYTEGDTKFQNATVLTLQEAKEGINELVRFYAGMDC